MEPMGPPPPSNLDAPARDPRQVALIAFVAVAAVVAAVLGVIVLVNAGDNGTADASPTATPSAGSPSATATAIESTSSEASPSESAVPSPTPPVIPQATLTAGWAVSTDPVTTRQDPGSGAAPADELAGGEVFLVKGGPAEADGADWYLVQPLSGPEAWLPSGPIDHPAAEMLSTDPSHLICGRVTHPRIFRVAGIIPGDLQADEVAALELAIATSQRACVTFNLKDGAPIALQSIDGRACGAPSWDGDELTLSPAAATGSETGPRVRREVLVRPLVYLGRAATGADGLTNLAKVAILGSRLGHPTACVGISMNEDGTGQARARQATVSDCFIVTERSDDHISIAAGDGSDPLTFDIPNRSSIQNIPIGVLSMLSIESFTNEGPRRGTEQLNIDNDGACAA